MKLIIALLFALVAFAAADRWAVLVAGSDGYKNYRHQADLGHAYQILIEAGYDDDKIILFSYDDVANNYQNPFPGQLFNKPGYNSPNVYPGSARIDYRGSDVTPQRYLSVLKGESQSVGSRKTLRSGPNDDVFLAYFDHGATGLVGFPPMSAYRVLYADELISTLKQMHNQNKFNKLVYFMEACESGSMFQNLPSNINVYATTASNGSKPSAAAYCYDTSVHGKDINACLGDLYSINWMETVDKHTSGQTLEDLYQIVKKLTTYSPVQKFGTASMGNEYVSKYLGKSSDESWFNSWFTADDVRTMNKPADFINSRDAAVHHAYNQMLNSGDASLFRKETISRDFIDRFFNKFVKKAMNVEMVDVLEVTANVTTTNMPCYKAANEKIFNGCGISTEYGLKYSKAVLNICTMLPEEVVLAAIEC